MDRSDERGQLPRAMGHTEEVDGRPEGIPAGVEYALLGLLARQHAHAYELYARLGAQEALGLIWHLKQSHLYALLTKLEAAAYLTGTVESRGRRPPRRVLALTEAGRAALDGWLTAPVAHGREFRLEFLAKLSLAWELDAALVTALLARQREACAEWLAVLRTHLAAADPTRRIERLVLEFRLGQIEAITRWLDSCEAALPGGPGEALLADRLRGPMRDGGVRGVAADVVATSGPGTDDAPGAAGDERARGERRAGAGRLRRRE
jgi:DNA-binding PadR family transcriptional regulator